MAGRRRRPRAERGSASIEMAVLTPALIALFVMLMIAGRVTLARQAIEAAAFDAARTASLARDGSLAQTQAEAAATETLEAQGLNCTNPDLVEVDTSQFAVPVGRPAQVTATVTCAVTFADVALPGMPAGATFTASFVSPLDQFRSRIP